MISAIRFFSSANFLSFGRSLSNSLSQNPRGPVGRYFLICRQLDNWRWRAVVGWRRGVSSNKQTVHEIVGTPVEQRARSDSRVLRRQTIRNSNLFEVVRSGRRRWIVIHQTESVLLAASWPRRPIPHEEPGPRLIRG